MRHATWAICAALILAGAASAQEKVKLEYRLAPGTELVYKVSGTLKTAPQEGWEVSEATLSGAERSFAADVEGRTGVMLILQAPEIVVTEKAKSNFGDGAKEREWKSMEATVFRMGLAGNVAARKPSKGKPVPPNAWEIGKLMENRELEWPVLPNGEVAVGSVWENVMDCSTPLLDHPARAKAVSTLAEIKVVDGHRCAVIKAKLTPKDDNPGNGQKVRTDVTGETEMLFDIESCFIRSVSSKFEAAECFNGYLLQKYTVETNLTLDSAKTLPADETAAAAKVTRALDSAIANLYDGDCDEATESLEKLRDGGLPDAWKTGVEIALFNAKVVVACARLPPQEAPLAAPTADELFADGQKAVNGENWTEAVAKFKELAEKYPNDPRTADALTAAAAVCENRLNDPKSADELRKKAAALKPGR